MTVVMLTAILLAFASVFTSLEAFIPSNAFLKKSMTRSLSSKSSSSLSMNAALIVQNKGGGHGELGFQLAKILTSHSKITSITILQDDACDDNKEPFKSYATDIPNVRIVKAPLSKDDDNSITAESLQSLLDGEEEESNNAVYDYIWDNASKGPDASFSKALCELAKTKWNVKLYTYVSSAGIYQPNDQTTFPMSEQTTPIKESSGQAKFEQYVLQNGLPLVSFRPQYIYGPKSNKHSYIDWYFDRLVRQLPLPIPGDGTQLVSLTHSEDVASLLACVLDHEEEAKEQCFFNCGTDALWSYNDVAMFCADAICENNNNNNDDDDTTTTTTSKEDLVMLEHYDANRFGKAYFPFRMTNFYISPTTMVKEKLLSWTGPKHDLKEDLKTWYYNGYLQRHGNDPTKEKLDLIKDWEIVIGHRTTLEVGSIYDKWDPIDFDVSDIKELKIDLTE